MSKLGFLRDSEYVIFPDTDLDWNQCPPNLIELMSALVEKKVVCLPAYNMHMTDPFAKRKDTMRELEAEGSMRFNWRRHAYGQYVPVKYSGEASSTGEIGKMMQLFCHAEDIEYDWDGTSADTFGIDPGFND